jgi:hypothetical protein
MSRVWAKARDKFTVKGHRCARVWQVVETPNRLIIQKQGVRRVATDPAVDTGGNPAAARSAGPVTAVAYQLRQAGSFCYLLDGIHRLGADLSDPACPSSVGALNKKRLLI